MTKVSRVTGMTRMTRVTRMSRLTGMTGSTRVTRITWMTTMMGLRGSGDNTGMKGKTRTSAVYMKAKITESTRKFFQCVLFNNV